MRHAFRFSCLAVALTLAGGGCKMNDEPRHTQSRVPSAESAIDLLEDEHAESNSEGREWLLAHPREAAEALSERLLAGASSNDAALVDVLAQLDQPGHAAVFRAVLLRGRDSGAENAARALAALGDAEAQAALSQAVTEGGAVTRGSVAVALARVTAPWSCAILDAGLSDPIPALRLRFARAAAAAGCVGPQRLRQLAESPENASIRDALLQLAD